MKIAISYKHVTLPQPLESALEKHIQKINALLKRYAPDLVHLHGTVERNPHRVEFSFSANLSLPTGVLHASAVAPDATTSARKALVELESQIKKHQALLRKQYEFKPRRGRAEGALA